MSRPDDVFYTKEHEWVRFEDKNTALIGITDYAIEQLGDVVYLELPDEGTEYDAGDSFGTVESTKTVSDLYCPISGKIISANTAISDNLAELMGDPYEAGWLVKVKFKSKDGELLSKSEYERYITEDE